MEGVRFQEESTSRIGQPKQKNNLRPKQLSIKVPKPTELVLEASRQPSSSMSSSTNFQAGASSSSAANATELCDLTEGERVAYGETDSQYVLLFRGFCTAGEGEPLRVVFFLHGGFWKSKYNIERAACSTVVGPLRLATDWVAFAEYRRLPADNGAGYPGTNDDVATGYAAVLNTLTTRFPDRELHVVIMGHSAGGYLALSLLANMYTTADTTLVKPLHTFAFAPVANLTMAALRHLSDSGDAVQKFVGGEPADVAELYKKACPTMNSHKLVEPEISFVVGFDDSDVPLPIVTSCHQAVVASANKAKIDPPNAKLIMYPDTDHYALVRADSHAWGLTMVRLNAIFANNQE